MEAFEPIPVASDWTEMSGRPAGWTTVHVLPPSLLVATRPGPTGAERPFAVRVMALVVGPSLPPAAIRLFPDWRTLVALNDLGPTGAQLLPPSSERSRPLAEPTTSTFGSLGDTAIVQYHCDDGTAPAVPVATAAVDEAGVERDTAPSAKNAARKSATEPAITARLRVTFMLSP